MTGSTRSRSRAAPPGGSRSAPSLIAILEAIALIVLMPLKTVEPYTLLVDRQTGFVQALRPIDAERIAPDRALTQSFLVQYVIAREGFDIDSLQEITARSRSGRRARRGPIISPPRRSRTRKARSPAIRARPSSRRGSRASRRSGATSRWSASRRGGATPAARLGPPSAWVAVIRYRYYRRADVDRGPVHQPARLPGGPLPAQRRGAAARPAAAARGRRPQVQIVPVPDAPAPAQTQPARPAQPEPEL